MQAYKKQACSFPFEIIITCTFSVIISAVADSPKGEAVTNQGPVARSLVSANRWLRGIKMYRFPWYLTLVSTNHALSNLGQNYNKICDILSFI